MPTHDDTGTLVLGGTFSSTRRAGSWAVPAHVLLRQRFGSTELDLTEAELEGPEVDLEVDMIGGSIELRLPEDVYVTSSLLTTFASYQDHRTDNRSSSPRSLVISGRARWGSVEVRGPKRRRHP